MKESCSGSKEKSCVLHLVEDCPLCRYEVTRTNSKYLPELIDLELKLEGLRKYIKEVEDDRAKLRNEVVAVKNDRFSKLEKFTALIVALNELTK